MSGWSDDPATSSTHIRAVHIGELRRAVDFYRAKLGLSGYPWTDNPVTSSTHIRAVHFTELRTAIQDLWNRHSLGTLPNWSVGSAPSPSRQVSARDINDLRGWVNTYDPPLGIWTGFHWCSPVNSANSVKAQQLLQASGRFGAVVIVGAAPPSVPGGDPGIDSSFTDACDKVMDAREASFGGRSLDQCIARIYYSEPLTINSPGQPNNIASTDDADTWLQHNGYYNSLDYFVMYGGRNVVLFNELNSTSEPQYNVDPRILGYLAYALEAV